VAARQVVDERWQVLIPVHQQTEKLIQPGQDGSDSESQVQDVVGLATGTGRAGLRGGRESGFRSAGKNVFHLLCPPQAEKN
jgi:hypothetical protein